MDLFKTPPLTSTISNTTVTPLYFPSDSPSFPTSVSQSSFPSTPNTPSDAGSLSDGIVGVGCSRGLARMRGGSIPIFLAVGEKVVKLGSERLRSREEEDEDEEEEIKSPGGPRREARGLGIEDSPYLRPSPLLNQVSKSSSDSSSSPSSSSSSSSTISTVSTALSSSHSFSQKLKPLTLPSDQNSNSHSRSNSQKPPPKNSSPASLLSAFTFSAYLSDWSDSPQNQTDEFEPTIGKDIECDEEAEGVNEFRMSDDSRLGLIRDARVGRWEEKGRESWKSSSDEGDNTNTTEKIIVDLGADQLPTPTTATDPQGLGIATPTDTIKFTPRSHPPKSTLQIPTSQPQQPSSTFPSFTPSPPLTPTTPKRPKSSSHAPSPTSPHTPRPRTADPSPSSSSHHVRPKTADPPSRKRLKTPDTDKRREREAREREREFERRRERGELKQQVESADLLINRSAISEDLASEVRIPDGVRSARMVGSGSGSGSGKKVVEGKQQGGKRYQMVSDGMDFDEGEVPLASECWKIRLKIDQEGFRSITPVLEFKSYDPATHLLSFIVSSNLAYPFHHGSMQSSPILRSILSHEFEDKDEREFLSRQANLHLKENGIWVVEGREGEGSWSFVYAVEDRFSLMGKVMGGEKSFRPIGVTVMPEVVDYWKGKKARFFSSLKKSVLPKLDAVRLPTLPTPTSTSAPSDLQSRAPTRPRNLSNSSHLPPSFQLPPTPPPADRVVANLAGGAQIVVRPDTVGGEMTERKRSSSGMTRRGSVIGEVGSEVKTPRKKNSRGLGGLGTPGSVKRPSTANATVGRGIGRDDEIGKESPARHLSFLENQENDSHSSFVKKFKKKLSQPKLVRPSTAGSNEPSTPFRSLRSQQTVEDFGTVRRREGERQVNTPGSG